MFKKKPAVATAPPQGRRVSFEQANAPVPRKTQRYRGISFKKEYCGPGAVVAPPPVVVAPPAVKPGEPAGGRKRAPSMIHAPTKHMIPPKAKEDKAKLTVVLDLDETLIYAREGPLYARPHLDELLDFLGKYCEPVVWTAGVRAYAQAVIRNIDAKGVIAHCIYRHSKWFTGQAGYAKDLSLVGRDLASTIIIENTPDCVRGYEENGVLVADYEGGEGQDNTLPAIEHLLDGLVKSGMSVPEYLRQCPLLTRQYVPTDLGDKLYLYCLDPNKSAEIRFNRDLQPAQ